MTTNDFRFALLCFDKEGSARQVLIDDTKLKSIINSTLGEITVHETIIEGITIKNTTNGTQSEL